MELLNAVNAVLPHLGEHVITRVEGARHPTVDLILAAIERQRMNILSEGLWFNELRLTLTANTSGMIDTPKDTIAIYGVGCNVALDGEQLFNLDTGSRYFDAPIKVLIVRDIPFERLPINIALCVTYAAGAEVYLQDYGRENTVPELQNLSERSRYKVAQEELRNRQYNSQRITRTRARAHRFR